MQDIRVAAAQFEHRDNDKVYNLSQIRALTHRAVEQGAQIVSFHEVCIPGYSWVQPLNKAELQEIAELVPDGASVRELVEIAKQFRVVVMAGLLEIDDERKVFSADRLQALTEQAEHPPRQATQCG